MNKIDSPIRLADLHGSILSAEDSDGERYDIAGFACDDYPECDTCGHIDEELVSEGYK